MNVSEVNKMTVVRKMREMRPGDQYMQHELELLEDLTNETVDSAANKGRKLGRREAASEFANWLVQRGFLDEDIQEVTKLTRDEISKIKNGT